MPYTPTQYHIDTSRPSSNFNHRIRFLVLHYTGADLPSSLNGLIHGDVSSHYIVPAQPIEGQPKIYQLVPESERAWHAGASRWQQFYNLNDNSIGIEIVNKGDEIKNGQVVFAHPFSDYQMNLVISLCKDIIQRYQLKPSAIVAHADISPGRKVDPGPLFPWKMLYDNGIGAWPDAADLDTFLNTLPKEVDLTDLQNALFTYGYAIQTTGKLDEQTRRHLVSFQMHFRPEKYDGNADIETWAIAKALVKKYCC